MESRLKEDEKSRITGGGVREYYYEGRPFDTELLKAEREEMEKEFMDQVVIIRDLADALKKDRTTVTKAIRRNDIEILRVRDPRTDQQVLAVAAEDVEQVKALFEPEYEIVDPADLL